MKVFSLMTVLFFSLIAVAGHAANLVQLSDLQYLGAFRVPQGTTDTNTFNYGGTSLAFNPANNSLFMTGMIGISFRPKSKSLPL